MESSELERAFRAFRDRADVGGLAAVFERTAPELLRTATVLCGDPVAGEDLLQATFLTAIERRGTWDDARPLVPWLVGILTRHAREARRRAGRHTDPERVRVPEAREPDAAAAAVEVRHELEGSLDDLPEPLRQVLVLSLRHDLAPAEIAVALGRSPSTVRSQLQRGLERLRAGLPRGIAPALALGGIGPRGLEAVRTAVLESGRNAVEPPVPPPAPTSTISGAVMLKTTVVALALSGALAFSFRPTAGEPVAVEPAEASATGAIAATEGAAAVATAPLPSAAEPAPREARAASMSPAAPVDHGDPPDREPGRAAALAKSRVLNVVVVDPNGEPVRGARVALAGVRLAEEPDSLYGWRAGKVAPSTTAADGLAQLVLPSEWNGKHPDAVSFTVDHPELVPFCSDLVELARGRVEVALAWGAAVEVAGWIRAADGEARRVTGLEPELGERSEVDGGDWFAFGDGRLSIGGLAPGEHQLALSHTDAAGRRFRSAITSLELEPGERGAIALELLPAARVAGRLDAGVPRPLVVYGTGAAGEVVAHQSGGDGRKLTRTLRAPVAADGTFAFEDVGPGLLEVAVLVGGWTSESPARGVNPTVEVAGLDVELVVPMVATGTLELTVRGPDGAPVEGVALQASVPIHWRDGRWQYFGAEASGRTDAAGRLLLEGVVPGTPRLLALHPELRIDGPIPLTSEAPLEGGPLAPGETRAVTLELVRR